MSDYYAIIDCEFHELLDPIDGPGWGIWACTVTLEDGSTIAGSIQGDGDSSWANETFESDIGEE